MGLCTKVDDGGDRARGVLTAYPNTVYYTDFGAFLFWKLRIESVRYIGGYGWMSWIEVGD